MSRSLLAAALALVACLSLTPAQEKKEQPKKKERIAIADPKEAAKDPDFAIQGEYEGEVTGPEGKKVKLAAQVIANGLGEFTVIFFEGGLPGTAKDVKKANTAKARRENEKVTIYVEGTKAGGSVGNGLLNIANPTNPEIAGKLTRVERKSRTLGEKPPEGALVLFGTEGDEANWTGGKIVALSDGKFLNVGIKSKEKFGAFKAHIEFRLAWMPNSTGQGRSNSGVYLQDRYECQVLDSFGLSGENNECGGIYTQHKPLVNMCYPPMVWQTYDIEFTPAEFDSAGKKTKNARATVYHNAVKIHDNVEFPKECPGGQKEGPMAGPFQFQDHGDPVVYRNVWVVAVK